MGPLELQVPKFRHLSGDVKKSGEEIYVRQMGAKSWHGKREFLKSKENPNHTHAEYITLPKINEEQISSFSLFSLSTPPPHQGLAKIQAIQIGGSFVTVNQGR